MLSLTLRFPRASSQNCWFVGGPFASAAPAFSSHLVAVVLTGTGSNAADGVQTVKAHGGWVIAQIPSNAASAGMPTAAVASGAVDFVSPLEKIGPALHAIVGGQLVPA